MTVEVSLTLNRLIKLDLLLDIYEIADIMQCSYHGVYGRIARYLYYLSQILNKDEFRTVELHNEVKHSTNSSIVYSKVYEYWMLIYKVIAIYVITPLLN